MNLALENVKPMPNKRKHKAALQPVDPRALAARAITDFFRLKLCHEFELTWQDLKIQYCSV